MATFPRTYLQERLKRSVIPDLDQDGSGLLDFPEFIRWWLCEPDARVR